MTSTTYKNADGSTIAYTPAPPAPAKPRMLVGSCNNTAQLAGATISRWYLGQGDGFHIPTGLTAKGAPTTAALSFKDDPTTPAIQSAIRTALAVYAAPLWIDYDHEPEGDTSNQIYIDRTNALADLLASIGRPNIRQFQTFTQYEEVHLNKGVRAEDIFVKRPGMILGLDCYQEHQTGTYTLSKPFFSRLLEIGRNVGVTDVAVFELGRQPFTDDATGQGAGMAYASDLAYLNGLTIADDGVQCIAALLWGTGGCALTAHQLPYVTAAMAALAA